MKKQIYRVAAILLAAAVSVSAAGCGSQEAGQAEVAEAVSAAENTSTEETSGEEENTEEAGTQAVTWTDALDREVTVEKNPGRVAVLIGSFADVWALAGGEDSIVAAAHDTWTSFDLDLADTVIDLGSSKEISLEQIVAAEPDLVIASANTQSDIDMLDSFTQMGINVVYFQVSTFDQYLDMLDICTQITGCRDLYQTNGLGVKAQVDSAIEKSETALAASGAEEGPSVLYIRVSGSSWKVKNSENSVLGEMLADLGTVNIADGGTEDEQLSLEQIVAADPDYIFVILQSSDPSEAQAILDEQLISQPVWAGLTAVKEDRYYVLDETLYNLKPNDRWGIAYEQLCDILYPEE